MLDPEHGPTVYPEMAKFFTWSAFSLVISMQLLTAQRESGESKHQAIRAAVRGGWVNVLLTDISTARALLG